MLVIMCLEGGSSQHYQELSHIYSDGLVTVKGVDLQHHRK